MRQLNLAVYSLIDYYDKSRFDTEKTKNFKKRIDN